MAFTSYPAAGTRLTAATLQALISELRPLEAVKASDETVNNSNSLQDDNALFLSVPISTVWEFDLRLTVSSGTTPDFKLGWTFPTGLTMTYDIFEGDTPSTAASVIQGPFVQTDVPAFSGIGSDQPILVRGTFTVSTTAGTLQLRWAQNVANASDTIVRAGSYLVARRLS